MKNIPKKIVILGYMGSGKSTIGKGLATILSKKFIDLDDYIIENEKISINELFEKLGQTHFRKIEFQYLKKILKIDEPLVLSLGGGTPSINNAMKTINKQAYSLYLKANDTTLTNRLFPIKAKRPLLKGLKDEDIQFFIGEHLKERTKFYEYAQWILEVDHLTEHEVISLIVNHLESL